MTTEEAGQQALVDDNGQDAGEAKAESINRCEDVVDPEHVSGGDDAREENERAAEDKHDAEMETTSGSASSEHQADETLVVLELCDFKNHPLFDDYSSATLEGIDTATPMLRIGEYTLHGKLEETVGTSYFYDTDAARAADKTYQFAGQTIKKIKFTITPPEEF